MTPEEAVRKGIISPTKAEMIMRRRALRSVEEQLDVAVDALDEAGTAMAGGRCGDVVRHANSVIAACGSARAYASAGGVGGARMARWSSSVSRWEKDAAGMIRTCRELEERSR